MTGANAMRLGVDGRELRDGVRTGIGRYLLEVLRAASQAGWRCLVYGNGATRLGGDLPGVALRPLPARWTPWWDQVSLPRALARDGVSVFLSPYYKGPLRAPCPVVLTIHDLFFIDDAGRPPGYRPAATWLARLYARRATAIISDSEHSKRAILERLGLGAEQVTVIPVALGAEFKPGAWTDALTRRYGVTPPYILYVGNFKPHKNVPRLLGAYAALPEPIRRTHPLVLAGGDQANRPALEARARALGVAAHVVFPGLIEERDLPVLYGSSAVFVLPSLEEGFGLPALEAMACGAPVVATTRASVPEVVGDAALPVDPEDERAIAEAVARVLSAPALRDDLVRRGRRRARMFSAEHTSARVLALLHEVGHTGGRH